MAAVGAVEGFVAQGKIGDDVALDRGFEQRPLEPRGVAQVAAGDAAEGVEAQPGEDVAAEALDQGRPLPRAGRDVGLQGAERKRGEELVEEAEALLATSSPTSPCSTRASTAPTPATTSDPMRKLLLESLFRQPLTEAPPAAAALAALATAVGRAGRRRLGRSLSIRKVDAGSCNGCELEIRALENADRPPRAPPRPLGTGQRLGGEILTPRQERPNQRRSRPAAGAPRLTGATSCCVAGWRL